MPSRVTVQTFLASGCTQTHTIAHHLRNSFFTTMESALCHWKKVILSLWLSWFFLLVPMRQVIFFLSQRLADRSYSFRLSLTVYWDAKVTHKLEVTNKFMTFSLIHFRSPRLMCNIYSSEISKNNSFLIQDSKNAVTCSFEIWGKYSLPFTDYSDKTSSF